MDKSNHEEKSEQENGIQSPDQQSTDLKVEISKLQHELNEEKDRHLRTRADLDNLRKRIQRDNETTRIHAKKNLLSELLVFLDYFEQASKQIQDPDATAGIKIMHRQLNDLLNKHGLSPIDCLGKPFDPEEQEGVGYLETDHYPEGCVAEELCTGYKIGDILIKPARVMVAKKPST